MSRPCGGCEVAGFEHDRAGLVRCAVEETRDFAADHESHKAVVRDLAPQEFACILAIAKNRNVPEEVLRIIATTAEWMRSYQIKRNLVENPKCPQMIAMKLVQHMRESDLRALAKSKNIMGPVKDAARRQLEKRK